MRAPILAVIFVSSLVFGGSCKLFNPSGLKITINPKNLDVRAEVIQLKPGVKILFQTASDEIFPESFEILDELALIMEQNPDLRIRVEGHTDSDGDDNDNVKLSDRRAASVRAYLSGRKNINGNRLESEGCGEKTPIADNETEEGKQQNRRVEFVILKKGKEPKCKLYK
jgi:outer membrane protein OmpA-like peptidoglycan-associated protein